LENRINGNTIDGPINELRKEMNMKIELVVSEISKACKLKLKNKTNNDFDEAVKNKLKPKRKSIFLV